MLFLRVDCFVVVVFCSSLLFVVGCCVGVVACCVVFVVCCLLFVMCWLCNCWLLMWFVVKRCVLSWWPLLMCVVVCRCSLCSFLLLVILYL